jgi:hypothetical protein
MWDLLQGKKKPWGSEHCEIDYGFIWLIMLPCETVLSLLAMCLKRQNLTAHTAD